MAHHLSWECPACVMENDGDNEVCETCGEERPEDAMLDSVGGDSDDNAEWECEECFTDSKASSPVCEMCGAPRPSPTADDAAPAATAEDAGADSEAGAAATASPPQDSPSPRIPSDPGQGAVCPTPPGSTPLDTSLSPATPPNLPLTITKVPSTLSHTSCATLPSAAVRELKEEHRRAREELEKELRQVRMARDEEVSRLGAEAGALRDNQDQLTAELAGLQLRVLEAEGAEKRQRHESEKHAEKAQRLQDDADQERKRLRAQVEEAKDKAAQLEAQARKDSEAHAKALDGAVADASVLEAKLAEAQAGHGSHQAAAEAAGLQLAEARAALEAAQQGEAGVQARLAAAEAEAAELRQRVASLQQDCETAAGDSASVEAGLRAERDELQRSCAAAQAEADTLRQRTEQLQADLEAALAQGADRGQAEAEQAASLQAALDQQTAECAKAQAEAAACTQEQVASRDEIAALAAEKQSLQHTAAQQEGRVAELSSQLAEAQEGRDASAQDAVRLQKDVARLDEQAALLAKQRDDMQLAKDELQRTLEAAQAAAHGTEGAADRLAAAQASADALRADVGALQEAAQREGRQQAEQLQAAEEARAAVQAKADEAAALLAAAEARASAAEAQHAAVQKEADTLRAELARSGEGEASTHAETRIADLVDRVADLEGRLEGERDAKARDLQTAVSRAEDASRARAIELESQLQCVREQVLQLEPAAHEAELLRQEAAALTAQRDDLDTRLRQLEQQKASAADLAAAAAGEALSAAEDKVRELSACLKDSTAHVSPLRDDNARLTQRLRSLEEREASLQAELHTAQAAAAQAEARAAMETPASPVPLDVVESIKSEASLAAFRLEESIERQIQQKREHEAREAQWKKDATSLVARVAEADRRRHALEDEVRSLRGVAAEREQHHTTSTEGIQSLSPSQRDAMQVRFLKKKLVESEEAARMLEINLTTATQANKELSRQLIAAKKRGAAAAKQATPRVHPTDTPTARPAAAPAPAPQEAGVAEGLRSEVSRLQGCLAERDSALEVLKADAASAQAAHRDADAEVQRLRGEVEALQAGLQQGQGDAPAAAAAVPQEEAAEECAGVPGVSEPPESEQAQSPTPPSQSPSASPADQPEQMEQPGASVDAYSESQLEAADELTQRANEREQQLLEEVEFLRGQLAVDTQGGKAKGDREQIRELRAKLRESEGTNRTQHKELRDVRKAEDKAKRELDRICKRLETLDAKLQKADTEAREWKAKAKEVRKETSASAEKLRQLEAVKKAEAERNEMRDKYIGLIDKMSALEEAHQQEASTRDLLLRDVTQKVNKLEWQLEEQTTRHARQSTEHVKLLAAERKKVVQLQRELHTMRADLRQNKGYLSFADAHEGTSANRSRGGSASPSQHQPDGSARLEQAVPGSPRGAVLPAGGSARRSRSAGSPRSSTGKEKDKEKPFLRDPSPFVHRVLEMNLPAPPPPSDVYRPVRRRSSRGAGPPSRGNSVSTPRNLGSPVV